MGRLFLSRGIRLLLVKEFLFLTLFNKLLYEDVGTGLGALFHADNLHHVLCTGFCIEGCNCFFCHSLDLLLIT